MKISQSAREAAAKIACGAHRERILSGDWDDDPTIQAIAAAEARGREEMREMAAKVVEALMVAYERNRVNGESLSNAAGLIRALPIGEE